MTDKSVISRRKAKQHEGKQRTRGDKNVQGRRNFIDI